MLLDAPPAPESPELTLVAAFNRLYYQGRAGTAGPPWHAVTWRGHCLAKNPCDVWMLGELIALTRPNLIIETGTYYGGSAIWMADVAQLSYGGGATVLSIDIAPHATPAHERVRYVLGSSVDAMVLRQIRKAIAGAERVMVVLDADHRAGHVADELRLYAPLVTPGCCLIVEDTNVNGHPVLPKHGAGPGEALMAFRETSLGQSFAPIPDAEMHLLTFNPGGWLVRRP